jgi:hypothetical protein
MCIGFLTEKAMPKTDEERRAYSRAYYQANKEKAKEYARKFTEANKDYHKEYRLKNAERIKMQRKKYEGENKERIKEMAKASAMKRFAENPEKVRKARQAVRQKQMDKDPERYVELRRKYIRNSVKRKVKEVTDHYLAYLLSVSSGSRLYPTDIPRELLEAKRLQLMIKRELEK